MRIIYIDVLLFVNLYITYFLIIGTCRLIHKKITPVRALLGSVAGSTSSLLILLPALPFIFNISIRLFVSSIIILISMGFKTIKIFLKNTFLFFTVNCIYAGIMLLLWMFSAPVGMVYNNWVTYFDIPLWVMIISTSAAYLLLVFIRRVLDSKTSLDKKYIIKIYTEKGCAELCATADSGNKLTDFLTGIPVIFCNIQKCISVCPNDVINCIFDDTYKNQPIKGVRIIPYSTVSGSSLAYCFKPDKIVINDGTAEKEINALIGFTRDNISNNDFEAIFNPNLL